MADLGISARVGTDVFPALRERGMKVYDKMT